MTDVKVAVNEPAAPSAELIAKAKQPVTITDSKGRVIVLAKPGVLAQYRFVEVMGDSARNQVLMGMLLPLTFVESIDGSAVTKQTRRQIDALIQQLDEDGIQAVMAGVQENFGTPDPEADKASIKN